MIKKQDPMTPNQKTYLPDANDNDQLMVDNPFWIPLLIFPENFPRITIFISFDKDGQVAFFLFCFNFFF